MLNNSFKILTYNIILVKCGYTFQQRGARNILINGVSTNMEIFQDKPTCLDKVDNNHIAQPLT